MERWKLDIQGGQCRHKVGKTRVTISLYIYCQRRINNLPTRSDIPCKVFPSFSLNKRPLNIKFWICFGIYKSQLDFHRIPLDLIRFES